MMITTDSTPTGLSGLLSQILGDLGEGGTLEGADGDRFVQSLASHIKALMLEHGEDPVEVAAIDDETLVTQFLALVQGQTEPTASAGWLSTLGRLGETVGDTETPIDFSEQEDRSDAASSEPESSILAGLASLPTVVLERLSEAGRVLSREMPQNPLESISGSVDPSDAAPLDPETLKRALESKTPAMQDTGLSEVMEGLETVESVPVLPSWLARQSTGGDSGTWVAASMRSDRVLETSPAMQSGLESGELMERAESRELSDLTPSGPTRMPTTETPTIGTRLQTLDLNRLLQPGGETRLAEQVRWSVDKGIETAEIKLHPPSLGTLDVRVVQEGDKTHVQFVSAHPVAREVLEAAMPRLREALAQDGVVLGNVSVSDQAPRDRGGSGREGGESTGAEDIETEDDEDRIESRGTISVLSRRLDVFT